MNFKSADKTILVVDDEAEIREALALALEIEGYRVEAAQNGKEALEALREAPLPHAILVDLMMPEMNGWEFLESCASIERLSKIPVIVASATRGCDSHPHAHAFLAKPIELDDLYETIARCTL